MIRTAVVPVIAACGVVLNAYRRGEQPACYALTLTTSSSRRPHKHRVGVLTVSKRKGHAPGDVLSPGVPYPKGANASLHIGRRAFAFSTDHNSAFAHDSRR